MDAGASSTLLLLALGTRPRHSISYHGASRARSLDPCVLIAPHYVQPRRAMPIALCSELDSVASTNGILRIRCLSMGYRLSITLQPSAHATLSHAVLDPPPPISDSAGRCACPAGIRRAPVLPPAHPTHTNTHTRPQPDAHARVHAIQALRASRAECYTVRPWLHDDAVDAAYALARYSTPAPPFFLSSSTRIAQPLRADGV